MLFSCNAKCHTRNKTKIEGNIILFSYPVCMCFSWPCFIISIRKKFSLDKFEVIENAIKLIIFIIAQKTINCVHVGKYLITFTLRTVWTNLVIKSFSYTRKFTYLTTPLPSLYVRPVVLSTLQVQFSDDYTYIIVGINKYGQFVFIKHR